ncbi:MAG: putative porin [Acidobacteriota bacterium]
MKVARFRAIRRWSLAVVSALAMLLPVVTVGARPTAGHANRTPRKSKRTMRQAREAKSAVPGHAPADAPADGPAKGMVSRDQIAALSQRVAELSQQLAAHSARPVEDADARHEIARLKERFEAAEERAVAAERVAAALRSEMAANAESVKAPEKTVEGAASTFKEPQAKIETAAAQSAQSEAAIRRIGPFRFGGDFRLRADAIWRHAFSNPGPGQTALLHAQNIRARYRFRFNLDADLNSWISFHGQLTTGPVNNPLTLDQEFGAIVARHPFFINEASVDFHPTKSFSIQGGRLQEVFADNSRFLFDDDVRFNGFNEKFVHTFARPVAGIKSIELRAGQYIFTNPNIAIVTDANLGQAGARIGLTGRASHMFHQGLLLNSRISEEASQQFGADIQLYHNPNQIQFASTLTGLPILDQNSLGLALSGPLAQIGTATTTPGGAIYSAPHFQVARLTYRLDYHGFKSGAHEFPISFNVQVARNVGTAQRERDALLASLKVGNVRSRGDQSFLYVFAIKGANALISQLTDDDLGTVVGVNIRTHHLRYDIGLAKGLQWQSLLFIQNELRNSGQYPKFFVPLNAFTPRQFRIQEQLVFTF